MMKVISSERKDKIVSDFVQLPIEIKTLNEHKCRRCGSSMIEIDREFYPDGALKRVAWKCTKCRYICGEFHVGF